MREMYWGDKMNPDRFNELIDALGTILSSFRSVDTFPTQTNVLLSQTIQKIREVKSEAPVPSAEERDALIDLENDLQSFAVAIPEYGRNLTLAREKFKTILRKFLALLNAIGTTNPKYAQWIASLVGYKQLLRMVA